MIKSIKQNEKLHYAIILSIALHSTLITVLIWNSTNQQQKLNDNNSKSYINAVMIDPVTMIKQYESYQKKADIQWNKQYDLNKLDKEHLAKQVKAEANKHKKIEIKKNTNTSALKTKAKQLGHNKNIIEKEIVPINNQSIYNIDTLLDGLTEDINKPLLSDRSKHTYPSKTEIDAYKAQISKAISNKFYDAANYSGKTCDLRIKLAPNGLLLSIASVRGDSALCQAAISAARMAIIPQPPNTQIYDIFKNSTIVFSPK